MKLTGPDYVFFWDHLGVPTRGSVNLETGAYLTYPVRYLKLEHKGSEKWIKEWVVELYCPPLKFEGKGIYRTPTDLIVVQRINDKPMPKEVAVANPHQSVVDYYGPQYEAIHIYYTERPPKLESPPLFNYS